jgi:hypothetical protein
MHADVGGWVLVALCGTTTTALQGNDIGADQTP